MNSPRQTKCSEDRGILRLLGSSATTETAEEAARLDWVASGTVTLVVATAKADGETGDGEEDE